MAWGEQHKDFEVYTIEALGVHDAFNRIEKKYFQGRKRIAVSYEYMGATYKPYQYRVDRRDENFNKPLSALNKVYN
jgi:hypothetical protein